MRYRDGQRGGKKHHWQEGQQRQKRYLHAKLLHRQIVHQDGEKKVGCFVEQCQQVVTDAGILQGVQNPGARPARPGGEADFAARQAGHCPKYPHERREAVPDVGQCDGERGDEDDVERREDGGELRLYDKDTDSGVQGQLAEFDDHQEHDGTDHFEKRHALTAV